MPKPVDSEESNDINDSQRIQDAVETANAEDEKPKDDVDQDDQDDSEEDDAKNDGDDSGDSDDSEEGDKPSDDDEEDDDKKPEDKAPVERKFKNLAADDDTQYITNIERAYENSSSEAIRLSNELATTTRRVDAIISAAQKDPDLAKKLNEVLDANGVVTPSGTGEAAPTSNEVPNALDDPFLVDSKTKWQEQSKQEVEDILAANPELLSDPSLNANVKHWMEVFSQEEYRTKKRLMSGGEAMVAAMKHLGIEDRRQKQDVANKAKDLAAPTRPTKARQPKASKTALPDAAYDFAAKMGVSRESVEKFANK